MKTRSKLLILVGVVVLLGILWILLFAPINSKNRAKLVVDTFFIALKQNHLEDAYHIFNPPESIMSFDDFKKSKIANYKIKDWQSITGGTALCGDFRTENEDGWRSFHGEIADKSDQFSYFRYSDYLGKEPINQNGICHGG